MFLRRVTLRNNADDVRACGSHGIDRLLGGAGQCIKINEPRPYTFTRGELVNALTRLEVRVALTGPIAGKVNAESMADAIIQALEEANGG